MLKRRYTKRLKRIQSIPGKLVYVGNNHLVNVYGAEFQWFWDRVGGASEKAGMTEEKLAELLVSEGRL